MPLEIRVPEHRILMLMRFYVYDDNSAAVRVEDVLLVAFNTEFCVHLGGILWPLLFNTHTEDTMHVVLNGWKYGISAGVCVMCYYETLITSLLLSDQKMTRKHS